jgi:hypothetical protein
MSFQSSPIVGCQWYANNFGWTLRRGNIMVEGNTDVRYFERASDLYQHKYSLHLIGKDLSIFSSGTGEDGGTYGIAEKFPVLHSLAKYDVDSNGKMKYRMVALFDDDHMGRQAVRAICQGNRSINEYSQLYLLRRVMPRKSRDAGPLRQHTRDENSSFKGVDCVIEDLLDPIICDAYAQQYPQHIKVRPVVKDGIKRISWDQDGKFGLLKSVERESTIDELERFVEVLKSLRFYLGLPPDGIT